MSIGLVTSSVSSSTVQEAVIEQPLPVVAPTSIPALVPVAVNLGWIINKLYRMTGVDREVDDLPGLSFERQLQVYCWQIDSALARFSSGLHREQLDSDFAAVQAALLTKSLPASADSPEDYGDTRDNVDALHLTLMAALTAYSYKVGKAYLLGYGLAQLYRTWVATPGDEPVSCTEHDSGEIVKLLTHLADLHCVLPHNTAGTVSLSLQITERNLACGPAPSEHQAVFERAELRIQGHRWRAMLTGEMVVTDILETADYSRAAKDLIRNFRDLTRTAVVQFWFPLSCLALLGTAGIIASFTPGLGLLPGGGNLGILGASLSFATTFLAGMRIVSPNIIRVAERAGPKLWDEAVIQVVARALPLRSPAHLNSSESS